MVEVGAAAVAMTGPSARSGQQRDRLQARERVREGVAPGPASGQVQRREACTAGDPPGQGQVAAAQRLDDDRAACLEAEAGDVVRERADEQPGGVGEEAAGGSVVESRAFLEVADRELDLGVAAVIGLDLRERLCRGR